MNISMYIYIYIYRYMYIQNHNKKNKWLLIHITSFLSSDLLVSYRLPSAAR